PVAVPTGRAGVQGSVGVCESVLCAEHKNIAVHNTENITPRERQPNWDRARITPPPGQTTPEISCGKLFLVRRGSGARACSCRPKTARILLPCAHDVKQSCAFARHGGAIRIQQDPQDCYSM